MQVCSCDFTPSCCFAQSNIFYFTFCMLRIRWHGKYIRFCMTLKSAKESTVWRSKRWDPLAIFNIAALCSLSILLFFTDSRSKFCTKKECSSRMTMKAGQKEVFPPPFHCKIEQMLRKHFSKWWIGCFHSHEWSIISPFLEMFIARICNNVCCAPR